MKKITFILAAMIIGFSAAAQEMKLDEILNNYYETVGLRHLGEKKTVIMKGKSVMQGMETPFTMYRVRPDKFRIEVPIQGQMMIQVYNNGNAWMVAPWTGTTEPKDITGPQLKMMKKQNDIEGPLFNYKEKGNTVELIGKDDMEGSDVYKIKVTEKDGDITTYFIDADNFVVLKTASVTKINGEDVESETYYSNYKPVDDVIMPFSIENKMKGQQVSSISVDSIVFNSEVDTSIFEKPAPKTPSSQEKK